MRRALWLGVGVVGLHSALLAIAVSWSFVSALLAPGTHTALGALLFGAAFLLVRLVVLVALPTALVTTAVFLAASRIGRLFSGAANSPTRRAGPMLSAPERDEVAKWRCETTKTRVSPDAR